MNNGLISRAPLMAVPNVRKVTEYDEAGYGISYNAVPLEAIENAPSVDVVPKWISVQDRLPEIGQDVLAFAKGRLDNYIGITHMVITQRYIFRVLPGAEGHEEWSPPWPYFNMNYEITHWMPLPELPEKLKEESE